MYTTILVIGLLVFFAHFLSLQFRKTNIPDVLLLMVVGIVIGPIWGVATSQDFGKIGSLIATIALVVILFEGGTSKILQDPASFVLQTSLDDWYVSYEINAYTKEPERMAVIYSNLYQNIQEKFDDLGVEIMSPHYYSMRDGNASMVPSVLGGKGHTAPAFQISTGRVAD